MEAIRRPQTNTKYADEIIKTLLDLKKEGKAKNTVRTVATALRRLATNTDLHDPENVKLYISDLKRRNNTKQKLVYGYSCYCTTNKIQWKKPRYYKWDRIIPIIPTTQNIYKIISGATKKYATIFTILEQTGLEGQELATMQRKYIDAEQGIISCEGCKNHNGRQIPLKTATAELLREYLHKYTEETPFPSSKSMGEMWRRTRKQVARKLNQPDLLKIPLRNLRHHHACDYYRRVNNILSVMQRLGHKKIETTMLYTQLIAIEEDGQYDVQGADTKDQAKKLIEAGYEYVNTIEETALYRKRK